MTAIATARAAAAAALAAGDPAPVHGAGNISFAVAEFEEFCSVLASGETIELEVDAWTSILVRWTPDNVYYRYANQKGETARSCASPQDVFAFLCKPSLSGFRVSKAQEIRRWINARAAERRRAEVERERAARPTSAARLDGMPVDGHLMTLGLDHEGGAFLPFGAGVSLWIFPDGSRGMHVTVGRRGPAGDLDVRFQAVPAWSHPDQAANFAAEAAKGAAFVAAAFAAAAAAAAE